MSTYLVSAAKCTISFLKHRTTVYSACGNLKYAKKRYPIP